ncbi:hypothetical protein A0257_11760 [Hymenobacter psoromatis]|nr:hypothetical protein A0257_11760 [Hymenobacter psoromatis]
MSRRPKNRLARRWAGVLLLASLLAGGQWAAGQALPPVLRRTVAPTPGNRPLGAVLAELSRQSGLPFSYSSSLVPTAARCALRPGPARPLGEVLREVLGARHLTYGLLDGQLVLWPDHVAAPPNALAVNGYATPPGQPAGSPLVPEASASAAVSRTAAPLLRPLAAAARAGVAASAARPAGNSRYLASGPKKALAARALPPATGTNPSGRLAGRPGTARAAPQATTELLAKAAHGKAGHLPTRAGTTGAESLATAGRARPASSALASRGQGPRLAPSPAGRRTAAGAAATVSPAASLARLPMRPVPLATLALVGAPTLLSAGPAPAAAGRPAGNKPPRTAGYFLRRAYLHGEVWGSESLPLSAAAKLGTQRIYLMLGAATGPFGRGGLVGGVGLGTAGAARGRFTPSLDVIYWFLAGDRDDDDVSHAALAQLRPALAWQLRQGGPIQLFGGPTLNLATARHNGSRRWSFGQDQWLWASDTDDQTITRLWPGVQVGLRF